MRLKQQYKEITLTLALLAGLFFILAGQMARADEGEKGKNVEHAKDAEHGKSLDKSTAERVDRAIFSEINGRIHSRRHVYYSGDPLEISIKFSRGAELVSSGEADAYLVIFTPDLDEAAIVVPVSSAANTEMHKLFEVGAVDISTLPAGWYQLGLILTNSGGDPLAVTDWYRGLRGLQHIVGIVVTDEAVDYDKDGDGEVDDDSDGDGFGDDADSTDSSSGDTGGGTDTPTAS